MCADRNFSSENMSLLKVVMVLLDLICYHSRITKPSSMLPTNSVALAPPEQPNRPERVLTLAADDGNRAYMMSLLSIRKEHSTGILEAVSAFPLLPAASLRISFSVFLGLFLFACFQFQIKRRGKTLKPTQSWHPLTNHRQSLARKRSSGLRSSVISISCCTVTGLKRLDMTNTLKRVETCGM